jgi:hypothetical protein
MRLMPNKLPAAREEGLLIEQVADETVVYDTESKDAHCLSPLAAVVFSHCDGRTTLEEAATLASERLGEPVDVPSVLDALVQLDERDLIADDGRFGMSRRDMLRRSAAVAGAATVAGPLISTVMAQPAIAQSSATCGPLLCCPCGTASKGNANDCCFIRGVTLHCECTRADEANTGAKNCKPSGVGAKGTEFCKANPPSCAECRNNQATPANCSNVAPYCT